MSVIDPVSRPVSYNKWARDADLEQGGQEQDHKRTNWPGRLALAYASIGVIYGDIGTSPLYVYSSVFSSRNPTTQETVGVASLIFWTLTLIVLLKYVVIVLNADDNGEGGTFALYAKICRAANFAPGTDTPVVSDLALSSYVRRSPEPNALGRKIVQRIKHYLRRGRMARRISRWLNRSKAARLALLLVALLMTSMVLGDGVLTPAISVLSAVSGLQVASSKVTTDISVGVTCAILVILFCSQRFGTAEVSKVFAPIVLLWLVANAAIGIYNIVTYEGGSIFRALSPQYAINFFIDSPGDRGWKDLAGVFLCITGCEALYADLGHFSAEAVRLSFLCVAYPCLVITYFGQASWLIYHPTMVEKTYYKSVPNSLFYPMLILATLASVVASQALITGAFSLVRQSIALGCYPRVKVVHTSPSHRGQVYIPSVNYILLALTIIVVTTFKSTTSIGYAYGIAINTVMLGTTWLLFPVMLICWRLPPVIPLLYVVPFTFIEGVYLSSNLLKVPHGGWFSLAISAAVCCLSYLWHWGSNLRQNAEVSEKALLSELISVKRPSPNLGGSRAHLYHSSSFKPIARIPGIALVYSPTFLGVPQIFPKLLTKWGCHQTVIFITIRQVAIPNVAPEERLLLMPLEYSGFYRCVVRHGYMDTVDQGPTFVEEVLQKMKVVIDENRLNASGSKNLAKTSARLQEALSTVDFDAGEEVTAQYGSRRLRSLDSERNKEQSVVNGNDASLSTVTRALSSSGNIVPKEEDSIQCRNTEEGDAEMSWEFGTADNCVYVLSRSIIKTSENSNLFKRLCVEVGYDNMFKHVPRAWEQWRIPVDNMFEVGMIQKI